MSRGKGKLTAIFKPFLTWCKLRGFDLNFNEDHLKTLAAILLYGKYAEEEAAAAMQAAESARAEAMQVTGDDASGEPGQGEPIQD